MSKFFKNPQQIPGLSPGSLVYTGTKKKEKVKIEILDYTEKELSQKTVGKVKDCLPFKQKPTVTWLNVLGLHQVEVIEELGKELDLHPLILEDILNTHQRPKIEDYEDYLFITLKMIVYNPKLREIQIEPVSLVVGKNFVISFQEKAGDVFDEVRERIVKNKGKIRKMKSDYLAYALVDAIVDHYFSVLEELGEDLEEIEETLVTNANQQVLNNIHRLKRELIFLRKSVWPLREIINTLLREETNLIQKATRVFLRDVYDHTIQIIDTIETFRDMVAGMLDIYLSSVSNKLNEVMKILTIYSTIFIPLTFISGVYGMNFKFFPELEWKWGYLFVWSVFLTIVVGMLIYFRRKKWL